MKIEAKGDFVPIALVQLEPGEEIYSEGGLLVYSDPTIRFTTRWFTQGGLGAILRRTIGGVPFHIHVYTGPGAVAFSRSRPGEVRTIELAVGETVDLAEHSMLIATNSVGYSPYYISGAGGMGGLRRLEGIWFEKLTGPGTVVYHGHGNILSFNLAEGEKMDVDEGALLLKDSSVKVQPYSQQLGGGLMGHALSFSALHVEGPGRVSLQTVDPRRAHDS
jgi:uncharacterized protein (AIM24 family)